MLQQKEVFSKNLEIISSLSPNLNSVCTMTYKEAQHYIEASIPMFHDVGAKAYKEGLGDILELDSHLGHPHLKYKTIHVAGTNGKGSTCSMLASILQASGYRVGLFTSPHIKDFRERIRVNSQVISKKFISCFIEKERSFIDSIHPSFFELTTAIALKYFAYKKVDIAIIEVGLGGRLDSTNIITPILSIITNISLDHTQFLGETLEKIASEKAGIIKPKVPVVIGETQTETKDVFLSKAKEGASQIFFAQKKSEARDFKILPQGCLSFKSPSFGALETDLSGLYQEKNLNTVLSAIKILQTLGLKISKEHLKDGLKQVAKTTGLMGRWQKISSFPTVVCDTGHNPGGWQYIAKQLKTQPEKNLRIIFGLVSDKDYRSIMKMLPKKAIYYFAKSSSKRALSEETLLKMAKSLGLTSYSFSSVKKAFFAAKKDAQKDDFIFVGGSTFVVADFMRECL